MQEQQLSGSYPGIDLSKITNVIHHEAGESGGTTQSPGTAGTGTTAGSKFQQQQQEQGVFQDTTGNETLEPLRPSKFQQAQQPLDTIDVSQPKYGVVVTDLEDHLEPIATGQPAYGVSVVAPTFMGQPTGADIKITLSQLEENISILRSSINDLKQAWTENTARNVNTIKNSWASKECELYTNTLTVMDSKVQNTISALELLCSTYEKARDMINQNQTLVWDKVYNNQ